MILLLFPSLALGFGLEARTPAIPSQTAIGAALTSNLSGPIESVSDKLEDLIKDFDLVHETWIKAIRAASGAERTKLFNENPTQDYWTRFLGFVNDGEPLAAAWVIEHAREARLQPQELSDSVLGCFKLLFYDHPDKPELLGQAGDQLPTYSYALPPKEIALVLSDSFERAELAETKALSAFFLGDLLIRSEEDKQVQEGQAWLLRVQSEFADSSYAARAADRLFVLDHLMIGKIAPEFGGQSVDGDEIKLSDQRGKIVVVDFFGFW